MKFIPALLLFAAAFIAVYYNKLIREYVISIFKGYIAGIKLMIKNSTALIQTSNIIKIEILLAVIFLILSIAFQNWIFIALAIPTMFLLPKFYITAEKKKYKALYYAGLIGFLESIISAMKAGMSISKAFLQVSIRDKGPIGKEMAIVLKKMDLGMSMQEALYELSEKIVLRENEIIIAAICTSQETGGNITEVLGSILETIRKREELFREVKSLTSQGVISGIIVGSLPVFMIAIISFMDPLFIAPLFNTTIGNIALIVAFVMEITGGFFIAKIVDVR